MRSNLKFQHSWRVYQARVLDHLERYRSDRKVHIVAPPGGGKTVLGLEIVRRYNDTTLVLAPSLTIRNQWADRLRQDFAAPGADLKDLISHDLRAPAELTIVTYQALHQYLKTAEPTTLDWVKVLVVDECHHLRREWWRSLNNLCTLVEPELVALTATPPFDVSGLEWRRYHDFCGEIDEEISIPELVAAGDLCPHQDYVYPVLPAPQVLMASRTFGEQRAELYQLIKERIFLAQHIKIHPWLKEPEAHYKEIFKAPEYFSALLVLLGYLGSEPPATALGILHGELTIAPELNDEWLSIFLQKALRDDPYFEQAELVPLLRPIRRQLTAMGAWEKGKLYLSEPPGLRKKIRTSTAKIRAVSEIVAHEWEALGAQLRMVILTDYIYPELLPTTEYDHAELNKIGISTLFEQLRRDGLPDIAAATSLRAPVCPEGVAVITGSLVIIPAAARERLLAIAYTQLPADRRLRTEPLFPGSKYLKVTAGGNLAKYLVTWLTELFTEGTVNVLIGTTSLLGEGWDAPAINSLVLASTVGSFVLSNQMRGRAIRTYRNVPDKTANIWHPVAVNYALPGGGADMQVLRRRFKTFAGPSLEGQAVMMNGLRRYPIDLAAADLDEVADFTNKVLSLARQRQSLAARWTTALAGGDHLVEAVEPPTERYYAKEDRLSRYYFEQSDRQQRQELRLFRLRWKSAFILGFVGTFLLLFFLHPPDWLAYLFLLVGLPFGFGVFRGLRKIRRERAKLGLSPDEQGMPDRNYYLYPLLAALFFLIFTFTGPLFFLGALAVYVYVLMPKVQSSTTVKRYEIMASSRQRLERYGRALVAGLIEAGKLATTSTTQFTVEEDENGRQLAYLAQADHHDTHLFAESMNELMSPLDNPRFLLRLQHPPEWHQGDYYLPIPYTLAKTKQQSLYLKSALERELEQQFELIYTREPAGRLHLLSAKLQLAERSDDRAAKREMLWR